MDVKNGNRQRPNHLVGFTIRNPETRFISGFDSRMRAGRPAHPSEWTVKEAVCYSYFENANMLAESLYSQDDRMRSAAEFTINGLRHLRRGYQFHLHSVDFLIENAAKIYCVRDLATLDESFVDFFKDLILK